MKKIVRPARKASKRRAGGDAPRLRTSPSRPQPTERYRSLDRPRPIEKVLARLANVTPCGHGWSAICPGHGDRIPSLSVVEGGDGRVLMKCHAGCWIGDIVEELGLTMRDLFGRRRRRPFRYSSREG